VVQPHEIRPRSSDDPKVSKGSPITVSWLMLRFWRCLPVFLLFMQRLCNPFNLVWCTVINLACPSCTLSLLLYPLWACYLLGVCHACMLLDWTVVITINFHGVINYLNICTTCLIDHFSS
jgi:hypothetical protein